MGPGCLVEAGLFGDNILHRSSLGLQTFSSFLVLYRHHPHSDLLRFARGSGDWRFRRYAAGGWGDENGRIEGAFVRSQNAKWVRARASTEEQP